jgi:hypothetical protein
MIINHKNGIVGWIVICEELTMFPDFQTVAQEVYTTLEEAEAAAIEINEDVDWTRFCVNPVWIPATEKLVTGDSRLETLPEDGVDPAVRS